MRRSEFHFELPKERIAQYPLERRAASRLLVLDGATGAFADHRFEELPQLLDPGDLLVFNDTRVVPARLLGTKETGGKVEVLVERIVGDRHVLAHVRASRPPRPGMELVLEEQVRARTLGRDGDLFVLEIDDARPVLDVLAAHGRTPLPPYITRAAESPDADRYQTVYARKTGAVAAPTAGLHFDDALLERFLERGVSFAWVTLHVGAGTFQPVRVENIEEHRMHSEYLEVPAQTVEAVRECRASRRRVIAVGTTSVRALESAAQSGELRTFAGETDIFIYPGYDFRVVDAMITNFHLPESTLLMLVCAFAGREHVLAAYRHAVEQQYRFFSYGDAMLITRLGRSTDGDTREV